MTSSWKMRGAHLHLGTNRNCEIFVWYWVSWVLSVSPAIHFAQVCWKKDLVFSHTGWTISFLYGDAMWKPGATVVNENLIPITADCTMFRISHSLLILLI